MRNLRKYSFFEIISFGTPLFLYKEIMEKAERVLNFAETSFAESPFQISPSNFNPTFGKFRPSDGSLPFTYRKRIKQCDRKSPADMKTAQTRMSY